LEVLTGSGAITTGGASFTYTPSTAGIHLLRYIPVSAGGGKGNITYVYVWVNGYCTPDVCNLIPNSGFESVSDCGNLGDLYSPNVDCWNAAVHSPDVFARGCSIPFFNIPTTWQSPTPVDTHSHSLLPNDHFLGLGGQILLFDYFFSEAIQTTLTTPMVAGQAYTLSFWARLADDTIWGTYSTYIQFATAPSTLVPINDLMPLGTTSIPGTTPFIAPFLVDGDWHYYTATFTNTGPSDPVLVVSNAAYLVANTPPWQNLYIYLDDLSLTPANPITFTPPTTVGSCDSTFNLSVYTTPSGGTFAGYGVTGTYFNPAAALIASGGNPNITIFYAYTDTSGCILQKAATIYVSPCACEQPFSNYTTITGNISATSYTGNVYAYGDIYINSNVTFQNAIVLMGPETKIHINPGGKLHIIASHLFV
jgi:hypothetical protein